MKARNKKAEIARRIAAKKKNDRFYTFLKDMQDLLAAWAQGAALIAAGFFVVKSDLGVAPKLVAVLACVLVGAMGFISPVLLFFRYRLILKGQSTRVQVAKVTQFSVLVVMAVAAYTTTFHLMYREVVG
ncbi:hypothetical protein [Pseudoxanthomonas mexicana]|uniref:hypothetical protein n=1 Tax=Pseudoxanthomonas mexicana TaxID=128785 RepID=UPI0020A124D4|nr:hypothetical protein [Pseudoxanthomonas mexicana]MCP1582921.1 hypothetical protein [Pseudoxanthomonas mexicana]